MKSLTELGVGTLFEPGTPMSGIAAYIREQVAIRRPE
jgi:hypothetical protein